jgi:hypothetical protein
MRKGQRVKILIRAGLLDKPEGIRFVGVCEAGTVGVYRGGHPTGDMARNGWHIVQVGERFAPLHWSQFVEARGR